LWTVGHIPLKNGHREPSAIAHQTCATTTTIGRTRKREREASRVMEEEDSTIVIILMATRPSPTRMGDREVRVEEGGFREKH